MSQTPSNQNNDNWKNRVYVNGLVIGGVIGLVGAYLYARAAEEDAGRNGGVPTKLQTGQIISLALTILSLIRQIAETGKPKK
ncbi:MAG: hypothetical protein EA396_07045 [Anaerolineaceae bacterium]|nr:MAG: hypothetical protein EA396_07045 [Anaerolineaceae bacterium]